MESRFPWSGFGERFRRGARSPRPSPGRSAAEPLARFGQIGGLAAPPRPVTESLAALGGVAAASYGWGRLAFAVFYPGSRPLHAYAAGLGVLLLGFVGGLLNLCRAAGPITLAAL